MKFKDIPLSAIVGVKLVLAVLILAYVNGWIYFGDRSTYAEEAKKAEAAATDAKAKEGEKADSKTAAAADPAAASDEYEVNEKGEKRIKRKSFLDKLISLPKIEPDKMKKDEIGKYLSLADQKRQQVESRIEFMKERETRLVAIENRIDDKLRHLAEEKRLFGDTIQQERNLKDERTKELIDFYKKMPPKKAAPMFEKLNKDLVVEMFKQLPEKQVMNLLSLMDPAKSVEISEYYGRVRSGKEFDVLKEMNDSLRKEFLECKEPAVAAAPAEKVDAKDKDAKPEDKAASADKAATDKDAKDAH